MLCQDKRLYDWLHLNRSIGWRQEHAEKG
jgi:hypothetical protein